MDLMAGQQFTYIPIAMPLIRVPIISIIFNTSCDQRVVEHSIRPNNMDCPRKFKSFANTKVECGVIS